MTQPSRAHRRRRAAAKRCRKASQAVEITPVPLVPPTAPTTSTEATPTSSKIQPQPAAELGFSFAGGGWLMCYLFGVAKSIRRHNLHHTARFTGTSAGALASIGLALDADFDAITRTVTSSYVPQAHGSLSGPFQMRRYLVDALTRHANLDQFETCNADPLKCTVVYTSLSAFEPRRKSTFSSASHLLETLIASCCATPLVGLPFQFEGEWVIDGGLTENQPRFQSYHNVKRVVNVSPNVLDTDADIRPSQYVPPWWSMYPPSSEELEWVSSLGEKDGHDWCVRNGFGDSNIPANFSDLQRPRTGKHVVGQVIGYEWAERLLHVLMGVLAILQTSPTAHGLLQMELSMRKWITVCVAVVDRVMILWSAVVTTALLTILSGTSASNNALECLALACVHLAVWLSRLHHELLQLSKSPQWLEVEHSLRVVKSHAASEAVPEPHVLDLQTLGMYKRVLPRHHHEALAAKSILYRISSEFGEREPPRTH